MRVTALALILGLASSGAAIVGCDDEISSKETVKERDGKVVKESESVRETPGGDVVKEKEKTVDVKDDDKIDTP